MAADLVIRRPDISHYMLISPPLSFYNFKALTQLITPGSMMFAEADGFVFESEVLELVRAAKSNRYCRLNVILIKGANHFYKNRNNSILKAITDTLAMAM
ncbi:MAG: hypothetical protein ACKESB_01495 [Candidatus Hodgkinia cicadicola]